MVEKYKDYPQKTLKSLLTQLGERKSLLVRKQHKCRLVVDYSQTINRCTFLDAYPLPKIEEIVNKIGRDHFYSSLDLQSAYHQMTLQPDDRQYTAFKALGQLYQYKKLRFGVTNGASAFQRVMDQFIERHNLQRVYAYLHDLTVTGSSLGEHNQNLGILLKAAPQDRFTFNEKQSKLLQQAEVEWRTQGSRTKDTNASVFRRKRY